LHGDGRYNRAEEPEAEVMHITRGYSRDHRPDLHQVMLEVVVAHQAGMPVLMQPLSGNSSDAQECGQVIKEHITQLQATYGLTSLVAESALYSADNLQKFAQTKRKWITRVPATLQEAHQALAQAALQNRAPLTEGSRYHGLSSSYGGVAQRWLLIASEPRQSQATPTVDKQLLKHRAQEGQALKKLCRTPLACEADAPQALAALAADLQATDVHESTVCPPPR
jgi:transposase